MRFVSFASSSSGNSTLISYKNTNILVDCGISRKRIIDNLSRYNLNISDIDCILLTHSHTDHVQGLKYILKSDDIKVLGLRETLLAVDKSLESSDIKVNYDNFKILRPVNLLNDTEGIQIKDITVYPLKGCHDVPTLYYKFRLGNETIAILTDMGKFDDNVIRNLSDVNYLMLECNYDIQMLMESNRPEMLKSRILGEGGHLSNVECCEIIAKISNPGLKAIYLSHISAEANSEEYALEYVNKYIDDNKEDFKFIPKVSIARRLDYTEILNDDIGDISL